jgi:hypothetical protein
VGFAPTAVSLLSKVSTVAFFYGSVAGRPRSPSLLIRHHYNIAVNSASRKSSGSAAKMSPEQKQNVRETLLWWLCDPKLRTDIAPN